MAVDGLTPLKEILSWGNSLWDGDVTGMLDHVTHRIPVDVFETKDDIFVEASLAGFDRDNVRVEFDREQLIIRAERNFPPREARWIHAETPYGVFSRSVYVGKQVKEDAIEAGWHEGILRIRLPKVDEARPKAIPIQVAKQMPSIEGSTAQ